MQFKIIPFEKRHSAAFKDLNLEWLEKYFVLEDVDREVLGAPEKIVLAGGQIWMLEVNEKAVATCALIKRPGNQFELSKMAVNPQYRGMGLGKVLILNMIAEAQRSGADLLYLLSTKKLVPALNLYAKVGFRFKPVKKSDLLTYKRCDTRMEMNLK